MAAPSRSIRRKSNLNPVPETAIDLEDQEEENHEEGDHKEDDHKEDDHKEDDHKEDDSKDPETNDEGCHFLNRVEDPRPVMPVTLSHPGP